MAEDMKEMRRRKSAESEDAFTEDKPVEKKKIKVKKYVVRKDSKICVKTGVYNVGGDIVLLNSKMAKHFIKHGRIDPHVEFDDDDA